MAKVSRIAMISAVAVLCRANVTLAQQGNAIYGQWQSDAVRLIREMGESLKPPTPGASPPHRAVGRTESNFLSLDKDEL